MRSPLPRLPTAWTAPVVATLVLAGCGDTAGAPAAPLDAGFTVDLAQVEAAPPPAAPAAAPPSPQEAIADAAAAAHAAAPAPAADPVHLSIPAIGVDTSTIHLDLRADEAEVPESFHVAGWYRQTVEPGTMGPAVIVGHVGSRNGPGVFAELDRLQDGDEIHVTDEQGVTRTFRVDAGALVDKYDRPDNVFGRGEDRPELRLITCGGDFDPGTGHHVSNYVVWAHEVTP